MQRGVIIGGVLFLMLLMIGVIVYFMMSGDDDKSSTENTESETESTTVPDTESETTPKAAPKAAPKAPPPPSYVEVFGVDYPGNDIKHLPNTTLEKCKAEFEDTSIYKFKVKARDTFPTRAFQTSSIYLDAKSLPTS